MDGIIVTDPITGDARTESLFHTGIPIVASERFAKTSKYNAPIVCIDHQSALMKIFYRASELGCRHPSLICPEPESSGWGEIITKMFNTWCTRMGITGYVEHLPFSRESEAEVEMKVSGLLSMNPDVDLFLASSELEIREIERQLIEGKNPHGSVCHVASCSDSEALRSMPLPVTAINLRPYDLGWLTCQLLFELIGGSVVHDFTLEGETIFRGTMSLPTQAQ